MAVSRRSVASGADFSLSDCFQPVADMDHALAATNHLEHPDSTT